MTKAKHDQAPPSRVDAALEVVNNAYTTARDRTASAAQRAADGLGDNPIPALVGGLVVGLAAGVLLPRTERESAVLGPIGGRISDAARAAFDAAKETGGNSLGDVRLSSDNIGQQATKLVTEIATAAGNAGVEKFRSS